ncbi:MAG: LytR C-terminal domain-containing protein, partial [Patescibacteria group bacterium]
EDIAILTYYFLVIGVVWQMIELRNVKPAEEVNPESDENEIKIVVKKEVFQRRSPSYNYIFLKRGVLIISILVFFGFIIILFVKQIKPPVIKKPVVKQQIVTPIITPIITPILKPVAHASLVILNATDIRGLAGSSAATLRKDGWHKEFDISTGNYVGKETLSTNILKYTKNLEDKISLLERSLNIRVTPILLKQATQEAELTLILGK